MTASRVVIADDEAPARLRLRALLAEVAPALEVAAEAGTGLAAIAACERVAPAIVFLDIRMPEMDGLEAARHLALMPAPPVVVFTTAYEAHALEAFELAAVDYLMKPVRRERLAETIARCQARGGPTADVDLAASGPRRHLSAMVGADLRLVAVADVRYLLAEQKYVVAGWPDGELPLTESLKTMEEEFGERFVRVHRGALAAVAYVTALQRTGDGHHEVVLEGVSTRLPVSRRLLSEVRARLRRE